MGDWKRAFADESNRIEGMGLATEIEIKALIDFLALERVTVADLEAYVATVAPGHVLRRRDLRHEGVSRLFEMGMNIPHAAAVSGHRSWTSLKRYTHLRDHGDKYAGWKWLPVVTSPLPTI